VDGKKSREIVGSAVGSNLIPAAVRWAGPKAQRRFLEFFAAQIRNRNTREAYYRAVIDFLAWCDDRAFDLIDIEPVVVAAYVEYLGGIYAKPTVKQHLAAVRMVFDWLVTGGILPMNPASSVRGPTYVAKKGKTPVLTADEARRLLDSIDTSHIAGLRDRALISTMVFSFARVSAVVGMRVEDYYRIGKRSWLRLHEKGGKHHEVPAHHSAVEYLNAYVAAAGIGDDARSPLFRSIPGHSHEVTANGFSRQDALRMIKRRSRAAGLSEKICCHTFRATGITTYLENGGTIERAQAIAAHESPRTTKLYDRTSDEISLDELERIRI
jgi:site-specific recombinase XerD